MNWHPYRDLPAAAFWRKSVAQVAPPELDPVTSAPFQISRQDRVATAGSCFAQHIARHLRRAGFNFLMTVGAQHDLHSRPMAANRALRNITRGHSNPVALDAT